MSVSRKWMALFGISLSSAIFGLDVAIVNTALIPIQRELHTNLAQLQWIVGSFLIFLCSFMVILGRVADLFGHRRFLYLGMLLFLLASLLAAISQQVWELVAFRALQGFATAMVFPIGVAFIPMLFSPEERPKAIGIWTGVVGVAMALGPAVGGVIVSYLSWRWIFLINAPLILLAFLVCVPTLPKTEPPKEKVKLDLLGSFVLLVALFSLTLAIIEGQNWGWASWMSIVSFVIGGVFMVAFVFVELNVSSPIVRFRIFKNSSFLAGTLSNLLVGMYFYAFFWLLSIMLYQVFQYEGYQVGLFMLAITAMFGLLSVIVGFTLTEKITPFILLVGMLLLIVEVIIGIRLDIHSSVGYFLTVTLLLGFVFGLIYTPGVNLCIAVAPKPYLGMVSGMVATLRNMGGVVGMSLVVVVFRLGMHNDMDRYIHSINAKLSPAERGYLHRWVAALGQGKTTHLDALPDYVRRAINGRLNTAFIHGYHDAMWFMLWVTIAILVLFIFMQFIFKTKMVSHD